MGRATVPAPPTDARRYHGAVRSRRVVARFGAIPKGSGPTGAVALRRLRRHWGLLVVCAAFLLAGALALDDFGHSPDGFTQRLLGKAALDSLAGDGEFSIHPSLNFHDRYYGAAFEAPLTLVERTLGLEGEREFFLSRHVLTHLFFLAGGVFCYLLVLRMFGSRLLALIAMALFLLHPRLYAHSFYNSKDIPFATMFMIALYLVHRAFRRDTLAAFLLCGVGVALLVNLRVMGIVLFAAVLALRGLDLLFAGSAERRKGALLTGGGFALIATLTYYASLPALWTDPGRFPEAVRVVAQHPNVVTNFFRGEWLPSPEGPPFEYIPVWIGITTPPLVLLLAVIGAVWLCWRASRHPRDVWRETPLRFTILLLALIVSPAIAVFIAESNIYDGWRQVYFLYAPLALLAIMGLRWVVGVSGNRRIRSGLYALAAVGMAVTIVSIARIHPLQFDYFNSFVDRNRQDWLVQQYEMDYWTMMPREMVREVMEDHPDRQILFSGWSFYRHYAFFPRETRERMHRAEHLAANEFLVDGPVLVRGYEVKIYNNTVYTLASASQDLSPIIDRAISRDPLASSVFSVYRDGGALVYVREGCAEADAEDMFFLHLVPVDAEDLPAGRTQYGFDNLDFTFWRHGGWFGERCAAVVALPDYPIASIYTGQYDDTGNLWVVEFALPDGE